MSHVEQVTVTLSFFIDALDNEDENQIAQDKLGDDLIAAVEALPEVIEGGVKIGEWVNVLDEPA